MYIVNYWDYYCRYYVSDLSQLNNIIAKSKCESDIITYIVVNVSSYAAIAGEPTIS